MMLDFSMQNDASVLVETALPGRGMTFLDDEVLLYLWPAAAKIELLWLEAGKLRSGLLPDFLEVRGEKWPRINGRELAQRASRHGDGFLTASALMRAAAFLPGKKRRFIVTAGMGGLGQGVVSADLHELLRSKDVLVATAFKDSLELERSLVYLRNNGVRLLGWQCDHLDGFLFHEPSCPLDGSLETEAEIKKLARRGDGKSIVLFNPLPLSLRLRDRDMLASAMEQGDEARRAGLDYHPAVNEALDRASKGRASLLQLLALVANIHLACRLRGIVQKARRREPGTKRKETGGESR